MRRTIPAIFTALSLLAAVPSFATGEIEGLITQADRERLASFEKVRTAALREARAAGAPEDVSVLDGIVNAQALPMRDFDATGAWQCRTIKLGGPAELVIYGWFKCRITDDGSGWMLEKLTGSQRTKGRFFTESDTRSTYLGSFYVADEKPAPYGSGPDSDQVGYMTRSGADAFRIEFPSPAYESRFDILEFRR